MDLHVVRGTTLKSGKIYSINESVPSGITLEELTAGIADGTYTKKSLTGKTYQGEVRERAGAALRGTLVFDTTGDVLTFKLSAVTTKTWPKEVTTMFYNVLEITTATGEVEQKIAGKIHIEQSVTIEV